MLALAQELRGERERSGVSTTAELNATHNFKTLRLDLPPAVLEALLYVLWYGHEHIAVCVQRSKELITLRGCQL